MDVGYNSASVCAPRADRSLKIETGNLCGDSRQVVQQWAPLRVTKRPAVRVKPDLVWSLDLASAQTIELKSLILAQIERWRRA